MKTKTEKHKGQTLVELALVLPILLLLVFGIIDFGRILNAYIMVSNASREAARYYAVRSTQATAEAEAKALVLKKTPFITITDSDIDIKTENIVASEKKVTVTVSYKFEFMTPVGGIAKLINKDTDFSSEPFTIESSTVMRIE